MTNNESQHLADNFDVIIIGAGIQGAGVAQALAAAGWHVAVVEKANEPATETSSKSSKLIHGGLRYLETAQLSLVHECLRERHILSDVAPDLVKLKPFFIPVYYGHKRAPFWIWLGLALYRLLGGGDFKRHPVSRAKELGLNPNRLRAIFEYQDAQTDDVKLTNAVVASAKALRTTFFYNFNVVVVNCNAENYCVASEDGRKLSAPAIVNAGGAFVNLVAEQYDQWPSIAIELVQGTHLILDLPAPAGCIYTESPDDGRAVFLLPWYGKLMVGTTELSRGSDPSNNAVTPEERQYLLRVAAHALEGVLIEEITILKEFSGLRVLPSDQNSSANTKGKQQLNKRARDTRLIHQLAPNLQYVAVYGGKLTAYRATADKVVKLLKPYLPKKPAATTTDKIPLNSPKS